MVAGTENTSGPMLPSANLVVIHGTRSGHPNNPTEGIGTVRYCQQPDTTSYNWIIDTDGTIYELTGFELSAWHATYLNRRAWGIGLAQGTVDDPIFPAQVQALRWLLRELHTRKGVPLRWVRDENQAGVIQHKDSAQGQSYGKSDVGYQLPTDIF